MDYPGRKAHEELLAVARGEQPADLLLTGGRVADLFSVRLMEADVAVHQGRIAGPAEPGAYQARERIELDGAVLAPSFIDGHIHLESTLLTPPHLARLLVPWGTGVLVCDPHELANVMGSAGIENILQHSRGLDLDVFVMAPSCVPATPLETAGAELTAAELAPLADRDRVLGLAEVMNFPGLINGEPGLLDKIEGFSERIIDGHAPLLTGRELNAYLVGGPGSDHECSTLEEASEKLAKGMRIMVRQGSTAKNLEKLAPLIDRATSRRMMFVTDDSHPDDLLARGHLNPILARAVELGVDPLVALQMVSLNPAEYFGLKGRGAVAPGYRADLVALCDLEGFEPLLVFKDGRLVAREGQALGDPPGKIEPGPRSMNPAPFGPADLEIPAAGDKVRVIGLIPGELLTEERLLAPSVKDGRVVPDPGRDLAKLAVIERHHASGRIGLGLVQGLGLKRGALASSVAHDSHNLIGAGADDSDLLIALDRVREMGGGFCAVGGGSIQAELSLGLGGLMSLEPAETVARKMTELHRAAAGLGCPLDPFMILSFLALPVIPSLKLTDRGLVDVTRFEPVDLFV